jgi:nitric oxide synthase-interacting protein
LAPFVTLLTDDYFSQASKPTLPSFWSPSVTPSSNTNIVLHEVKKKIKSQPTCPESSEEKPHYYSLHTLVTVNFTEETDSKTKTTQRICPACKKAFSNSSRAMLAKPCGHVLCKSCVDKFMKPSGSHDPHTPESDPDAVRCYVCDTDLTEKKESTKKEGKGEKERIKPGLVELRREGTGFSAGGANKVQKITQSFQC